METDSYPEHDPFCAECSLQTHCSMAEEIPLPNGNCCHAYSSENAPDLVGMHRLLSWNSTKKSLFSPLCHQCMGDVKVNKGQMESTIYSLGAAVQINFGDQIASWTDLLASILKAGPPKVRKEALVSIDHVLNALNYHHFDNHVRTQRFAAMLPGIDLLNESSRASLISPWKTLVCSMIHHAPFCNGVAAYFFVGSQELLYEDCCYVQKKAGVIMWELQVFLQKFGSEIRKIGLSPMERYLLMAVIFLEPVESASPDLTLTIVHRHYADVLMFAIAERCGSDHWKRLMVYKRLEEFFDLLKPRLQGGYYAGRTLHVEQQIVEAARLN